METEIIEKIREHYEHAKSKHPYFCDMITCLSEYGANMHLELNRGTLAAGKVIRRVEADVVLLCEYYEAVQAYTQGDTAGAVEKIYDAIAVLLRVVDVLEGRQALGDPERDEARVWCVRRPLHKCVDCEMCPPPPLPEIEEIIAAHRETVVEGEVKTQKGENK